VRSELVTVDLAGARAITGMSANEIIGMIETSEIKWTWNIASKKSHRREIRILTVSAFNAREGLKRDLTFDQVIEILYGKPKTFISGKDFYRTWNSSGGLFFKLIDERAIQVARAWRRGPGGSPNIRWPEAVRFASERRIS